MTIIRQSSARVVANAIVVFARLVTAVHAKWQGSEPRDIQRVYYANHCSHGDFVLLWTVLPPALRRKTRPVAGADYWLRSSLRRFIGCDVFRSVLIERGAAQRDRNSVGGPVGDSVASAASGLVEGAVSSPVEGAVSGPVEGAVSGPVEGAVSGPVEGAVSSPVEGVVSGLDERAVSGPVEVSVSGVVGDPVAQMAEVLDSGDSLIVFPEGTRNTGNSRLLPFKSGLFHLAMAREQVQLVPVWISNLNRVLPKGEVIPIPLVCSVTFGPPLERIADESKAEFLARAEQSLMALAMLEAGGGGSQS